MTQRAKAIVAQIEVSKQSRLWVAEAEKHWLRAHGALLAAMDQGDETGTLRLDALEGLTLKASATYDAVVDSMRVHAQNLEKLRLLQAG